jgi:hypothetical protein
VSDYAVKNIDSEELGVSVFRYAPGKVATDGHLHKEPEEGDGVYGKGRWPAE